MGMIEYGCSKDTQNRMFQQYPYDSRLENEEGGMGGNSNFDCENQPNNDKIKVCFNDCDRRYLKTDQLISKSQYRTIYRGYDKESGCEIAWCVYPLKQLTEQQIT